VIASLWGADRRAACCGAGWEPAWVAVWRSWGLAAAPAAAGGLRVGAGRALRGLRHRRPRPPYTDV